MQPVKSYEIFILDDDAFCREMYEQHFKNLGFTEIKSFDDCGDCINHLTEQPDIIFLDNLTETSHGIEALKTIKRFNDNTGDHRTTCKIYGLYIGRSYCYNGNI